MNAGLVGPAMLFCPGNRPDRFVKAHRNADVAILDLEDAVGPEDKDTARTAVASALPALQSAVVRINSISSSWHAADIRTIGAAGGVQIMVPKVEHASDLDHLIGFDVIAICETAAGILHAEEIAAHPHCSGLLWGGEDLIADLGGRRSRSSSGTYHGVVAQARHMVLLAAASAGKRAIDGVHVKIDDIAGLQRETAEAADMGFQAKACIHPKHVPIIRSEFNPPAKELEWAKSVLKHATAHRGDVFTFQGEMIDEPLLRHARRILER
ncbi:citrate lyase subunit beta/citryl-CoA lyase [Rhodococcus sp. OAS809]|uniref:HpcH/HpaI aldolase/citrate lyase family protein n=1 Tax=Rhodococcus sp. OAS809 TaxID=2663874 RepID=UPI00178A03AF